MSVIQRNVTATPHGSRWTCVCIAFRRQCKAEATDNKGFTQTILMKSFFNPRNEAWHTGFFAAGEAIKESYEGMSDTQRANLVAWLERNDGLPPPGYI